MRYAPRPGARPFVSVRARRSRAPSALGTVPVEAPIPKWKEHSILLRCKLRAPLPDLRLQPACTSKTRLASISSHILLIGPWRNPGHGIDEFSVRPAESALQSRFSRQRILPPVPVSAYQRISMVATQDGTSESRARIAQGGCRFTGYGSFRARFQESGVRTPPEPPSDATTPAACVSPPPGTPGRW